SDKCASAQPASYVKNLAQLVPSEVEHSNSLKKMTDEQLEQAIEMVKQMLEARAGDGAKVIEGTAEPVGMLGPAELEQPQHKRSNRLLDVYPFRYYPASGGLASYGGFPERRV